MEMVEEYNMDTNVLTRRAWRDKSDLRKNEEWKIEIGDPEPKSLNVETLGIKENINSVRLQIKICTLWFEIKNKSVNTFLSERSLPIFLKLEALLE